MGVITVNFWDDRNGSNRLQTERDYDYFWDGDVKTGDLAVVRVNEVYKVVQVKGIKRCSTKATKWALNVFDMKAGEEMRDKAEKRKYLMDSLMEELEATRMAKRLREAVDNSENERVKLLFAEIQLLG